MSRVTKRIEKGRDMMPFVSIVRVENLNSDQTSWNLIQEKKSGVLNCHVVKSFE